MSDRWLNRYAVLLPLAFVALSIGPALLGFATLANVDLLTRYWPFVSIAGPHFAGTQFCNTDTIDAALPMTHYVRDQLFAGSIPSWQNLEMGGSPAASVPNFALLSPLSLPYFVLPMWLAPAFVKLGEIAIGFGGTYLFLRRLGSGRLPASTAGVVFASSGFMTMWSGWPQTRTAAFIPLLFWAVERLVQRLRITDAGILAAVVACMLFGGFPAVTGFTLCFCAVYFLVRILVLHRQARRRLLRSLGLAVGGLVGGFGLAAVQLAPFTSQFGGLDRATRVADGKHIYPFWSLLTTVDPTAFGTCVGGRIVGAGGSPTEYTSYVGAAAVALVFLALLTLARRGRGNHPARNARIFFGAAVVVAVVLGWVGGPLLHLLQDVPGLRLLYKYNSPGRITAPLEFLLAVLAGTAFDSILRGIQGGHADEAPPAVERAAPAAQHRAARHAARRWIPYAWAALVLAVVAAVGARIVLDAHSHLIRTHDWGLTRSTFLVPALLFALCLAIAVAALWLGKRYLKVLAAVVLPAVVVAQGVVFLRTEQPASDREFFYPVTSTHAFLAKHLGDDRFDAPDNVMYTATAAYYGLRTATGHSYTTQQWLDLLEAAYPGTRRGYSVAAFSPAFGPEQVAQSKILDLLGVKYYVYPPSVPAAPLSAPAQATTVLERGAHAACAVRSGPLRGITVAALAPLVPLPAAPSYVDVTVAAGGRSVTSSKYLQSDSFPAGALTIPVAGEDLPRTAAPATVTITLRGALGSLRLGSASSGLTCAPVPVPQDGLKLVYADQGSTVYLRPNAQPRIRWASSAEVETDSAAQVRTLQAGLPPGTVLLSAAGPAADGKPATVAVQTDTGDEVAAQVTAQGAGYLVVADGDSAPGWTATVDGHPAEIRAADHALVAVAVPAGTHRIVLSYAAPHQILGLGVSVISALLLIGLCLVEVRRRRRADSARSASGPLLRPTPDEARVT